MLDLFKKLSREAPAYWIKCCVDSWLSFWCLQNGLDPFLAVALRPRTHCFSWRPPVSQHKPCFSAPWVQCASIPQTLAVTWRFKKNLPSGVCSHPPPLTGGKSPLSRPAGSAFVQFSAYLTCYPFLVTSSPGRDCLISDPCRTQYSCPSVPSKYSNFRFVLKCFLWEKKTITVTVCDTLFFQAFYTYYAVSSSLSPSQG